MRFASLSLGNRPALDWLVALDHLQQLKHRLVVLLLVGEEHLVDEAVTKQRIVGVVELDVFEDLEGALAHVVEVGAKLLVAQDRQFAAGLARILDRVVEAPQLTMQRLAPANRLHQPELLEVGDVPEVPDQRAEDRGIDAIELLCVERLDQ
jgi:hypothetical protein